MRWPSPSGVQSSSEKIRHDPSWSRPVTISLIPTWSSCCFGCYAVSDCPLGSLPRLSWPAASSCCSSSSFTGGPSCRGTYAGSAAGPGRALLLFFRSFPPPRLPISPGLLAPSRPSPSPAKPMTASCRCLARCLVSGPVCLRRAASPARLLLPCVKRTMASRDH